jgi:alkylation response protein AidB-like acyl-CoA dehydrogenase
MTTVEARPEVLTDDMLQRFDERCPAYDRDNRFFQEDWDELRAAGYLNVALPTEYGGLGMTLSEVNRLQRRLAYHAPATAVAVNMHLYWIGTAATVHATGDPSCDWMLERAAEGHVFAAGHGEAGNDLPLLLSTTKAERVDGGWEITGHKIFGSLSPVWTFLGFHAMDASNPEAPQIVHGFLHRDSPRYRIEETWDTLGMRATGSHTVVLDDVLIPDEAVSLIRPGNEWHPVWSTVVGAAMPLIMSSYVGVAEAAAERAVALATRRAARPDVAPVVGRMLGRLTSARDSVRAMIDSSRNLRFDNTLEHTATTLSRKSTATAAAIDTVSMALDAGGGAAYARGSGIDRLFRDVQGARYHPLSTERQEGFTGRIALGLDPLD